MDRMKANYKAGILACLLWTAQGANAGWDDWMKKLDQTLSTPGAADAGATALSQTEIAAGLKQALSTGVDRATALLGREGGFANDAAVRIALPESLQTLAQGLRAAGQGAIVDEFTASMNRAAEKAVPATTGERPSGPIGEWEGELFTSPIVGLPAFRDQRPCRRVAATGCQI